MFNIPYIHNMFKTETPYELKYIICFTMSYSAINAQILQCVNMHTAVMMVMFFNAYQRTQWYIALPSKSARWSGMRERLGKAAV